MCRGRSISLLNMIYIMEIALQLLGLSFFFERFYKNIHVRAESGKSVCVYGISMDVFTCFCACVRENERVVGLYIGRIRSDKQSDFRSTILLPL